MKTRIILALVLTVFFWLNNLLGTEAKIIINNKERYSVRYKKLRVKKVDIFYREAGDVNSPTILFLHGFPSSSHMYRNIINNLSSKYHVIAPDYPGFGLSSSPSTNSFNYTFDNLSEVVEQFVDQLGLKE